jgi:hypothetical protein
MSEPPEPAKTMESSVEEARFCQRCGFSLIPLTIPHVSRPCQTCGKKINFVNPGEDGNGIKVEKGDTFTIPQGWLKLSLDPAMSAGTFTHDGLNWFVHRLIFGALPTAPEKVAEYFRYLDGEADKVLLASPRMNDLDINSQADMNTASERFKNEPNSIEFTAILLSAGAHRSLDLMESDDSREELARWVAVAVAAQMMLIYKQALENHVWAGYEQTRLVYGIAAAGASTPKEAKAIEALRPVFANLSEEVLAAWVGADVSVKERLGIHGVDDAVVNALARFHLAQFEQRRQKDALAEESRSRKWGTRIAAAAVGATLAGVVVTMLINLGVIQASRPTSPSTPSPSVSQALRPSPAGSPGGSQSRQP